MNERKTRYGKLFVLLITVDFYSGPALGNYDYGAGIVVRRMLWYESPYMWVGAALLFLGLLILFIRRNEEN